MLTIADITKEFPTLKGFEPDGSTDFKRVAQVIGSTNPTIVWKIVNVLSAKPKAAPSAALSRLMAKLEK